MFTDRKQEQKDIQKVLDRSHGTILVYGRKGTGKTTLVMKALEDSKDKTVCFRFQDVTLEENARLFSAACARAGVMPEGMEFSSFINAFAYINSLAGSYNIVLEDYPVLKQKTSGGLVDSQFQFIIDQYTPNIRLFVTGSKVGMMRELMEYRNPLYNRFRKVIFLDGLSYADCGASFYPNSSVYDRTALYSVFGGSPYINCQLDASLSVVENIMGMLEDGASKIATYVQDIVAEAESTETIHGILQALATGRKTCEELESLLHMPSCRVLSEQLEQLEYADIISMVTAINARNDGLVWYDIRDNLVRCYYRYLYGNEQTLDALGPVDFYKTVIEPDLWTQFIPMRFEQICWDYFSLLSYAGRMEDYMNMGMWSYKDSETGTDRLFGVALMRQDGVELHETTYSKSPVSRKLVEDRYADMDRIKNAKIVKKGFISVNGYEQDCEGMPDLLTGEDLYNI